MIVHESLFVPQEWYSVEVILEISHLPFLQNRRAQSNSKNNSQQKMEPLNF